jgi:type IV pilus assembly protein PilB
MPKTFVEKLADIFVAQALVSEKEASALRRSFKESGKEQFVDFLVEEGLMQPVHILEALSIYYEVPFIDATDTFFDKHLLRMFPKDFLLRHAVIPLEVDQDTLFVIASEPDEVGLESALREFVSYDIELYVGIRLDISDAIKEFYDEAPTEVGGDEDLRNEHELEREEKVSENSSDEISEYEDSEEID